MSFRRPLVLLSGLALVCAAGLAQEKKAGPQPEMPKPGLEHKLLADDVGTWDAVVEMRMAPGAPPETSKGIEKVSMLGGFWQVTDFESTMMGQPFKGHGLAGFDPAKKKYVWTWVDSMSSGLSIGEGTYDAQTKTLTGTMEGPGPDGKPMKLKETIVWKDGGRVFTMAAPGPDGKDFTMMRIVYTRRK